MKKFIIITLIVIGLVLLALSFLNNPTYLTEINCELQEDSEVSMDELNAFRGDPCDCVQEKLKTINSIQANIDTGKYISYESLNEAINETLDGCMASAHNKEADLFWANSLKECETFGKLVQGMASIHATLLNLKQSEEQEFVQNLKGASGLLDKLQESAY